MKTSAEISYDLFDVTAKDDSHLSTNQKQSFIALDQLKKDSLSIKKYGTMELNQFILDGTFHSFPDEPEQEDFGLWSGEMSDSEGNFRLPIELTITFTENHSSLGLTFYFSEAGDWPYRTNIKWYNGAGELMHAQDYQPDSTVYVAEGQVEQYRKLVITFYGTNKPYRYLKLEAIDYGQKIVFDGQKLLSANLLEEIDPLSAEITINTLDFSIYTNDFMILDPQGAYAYLQKKQAAVVTGYMDGIKQNLGTFYMDEIESGSDKITTMKCLDSIGVMDQTEFKGDVYFNIPASNIISWIMSSAKVAYEFDNRLNIPLSGHLPTCTHREALQQVAFAIGAIVDCSRSGKIKIYPYPTGVAGRIPYERKVDGHKLKMKSLITGVEVVAHSYLTGEEEQEVINDTFTAGTHEIIFDEPMHDLVVTGGTIAESNANYAKIFVSSSGTVVLKGKAYNKNTQVVGAYIADMPAGESANVLKIEDATLVGPSNAKTVADRIYHHYQNRYQSEGDILLNDEEPGQLRVMDSMNKRQLIGIVEALDIDLTGGFLANLRMSGKAVTS